MIVKIIPFTRLPYFGATLGEKKEIAFFDYLVSDALQNKIKFGQLVQVPFRNKKVQGLVIGFKKTSKGRKLKEVIKIFTEECLINKEQLVLFKWLASFYFASLPTILKTSIPQPTRRKKKDDNENIYYSDKKSFSNLKVPKKSLPEIKKILNFVRYSQRKKFLFIWQSLDEKIAFYYFLIKKIVASRKRILIILPDIVETKTLLPHLAKISQKIVVLHSSLTKSEIWQRWQTISQGKAEIIIGTKMAVFAPIKNLDLIILENEENDLHHHEQFPYYDSRIILWKIAKTQRVKLIFSSPAPLVKDYYYAVNQNKFLPLELKKDEKNKKVIWVDMDKEIRKGNFSPLSDKLEDELIKNIKLNKTVILYLKRKGYASFVFCQDCGRIFNCPRCNLSLKTYKKKNVLWLSCHHCGYHEEIPLRCPSCGGSEIKIKGMAIDKIAELLSQKNNAFKNKIKIITENDQPEFKNGDIVITTMPFWRDFSEKWSKNIGSVGIVSADTMLAQPNFQAFEKTFQELTAINNWSIFFNLPLIIQTWSINNYAIQDAINGNFKNFYSQEISARKEFAYPPFRRFIKLTIQDKNYSKLKKNCEHFEKIIDKIENENVKITPYFAPPRRKTIFEKNYLIKIKNIHPLSPLPDELKKILPLNSYLDPS